MSFVRWTVFLATFALLPTFASAEIRSDAYQEVENWARLPEGRIWGAVFGVGIDSRGNVWVLDRCGGMICTDSNLAAVHEFDSSGRYIKSFGEGMFAFPHALRVDEDDNIWVADCGAANGKGNQVTKFSQDGKVLLTLGKKGVMGGSDDNFIGPSDMWIAPNGDIYVADGHAVGPGGGGVFYGYNPNANDASHMRIAKFSKDGKFIKGWGKEGTGPGEFIVPHGIAMDSKGRVFVGDRGNNRIQIFDQDGKFLEEWKQFGKAIGMYIDASDTLYVIDSDSVGGLTSLMYPIAGKPCSNCLQRVPRLTDVGQESAEIVQGIRIGSARDGVVKTVIYPNMSPEGPTMLPERLTADAQGNVYTAEARTPAFRKYAKKLELPEGAGKELVQRACTQCHDFSQLDRVNFDRQDWETTVAAMAGWGAPLKKEEIPVAAEYLAANFKPKNTPGVAVSGGVQASIEEWKVPTPFSMPATIRSTRSGVWYTAPAINGLGNFDPKTQKFEEYSLRPGTNPVGLIEYPHSNFLGTLFFTSESAGHVGEYHPLVNTLPSRAGQVLEHPIPGPKLLLNDITIGKAGRNELIWFTATQSRPPFYPEGSKVGSLHPWTTEIRIANTPTPNASPYNIAVNSVGIPFFTERNNSMLGSVDPVTMRVTEYLLPNPDTRATGIAITPDDAVWYADNTRGYVGRFDPKTGKFSEWKSPSGPSSRPDVMTSVGNIVWYSETGTKPNMLVRFDPATEKFQSWSVNGAGAIQHISADADGSLWISRPIANSIGHVVVQ